MKRLAGFLGVASMALVLPAAPAHAGGDITNFSVKNCTSERMFVCSFDKTDSLMTIPYKARGVQPTEKKEFGCASLSKCKVIIGVSKKNSKKTLSSGMQSALSTASVGSGVVAVGAGGLFVALGMMTVETLGMGLVVVGGGIAAAVISVGAGAAVAGIEIKDGWKDGDACNEVRKAAQKAGMKPKSFMKDGKAYQVIEQYAADENGNPYVNPDGTAVISYTTQQSKDACPAALATKQIVPN